MTSALYLTVLSTSNTTGFKVFLSVQNRGSWDQFSHQTKQHTEHHFKHLPESTFMRHKRKHVQQRHTWTSGGSQQQNNKQTKVCRSLTGFIVHGRAPLRQTKKTSQKRNMEMKKDLCSSHVSIHKHSPSVYSFWTSSLNRYGPGVIILQPHL